MAHTDHLFDIFLQLPLDDPHLFPMTSENKLKTVRSALYKIRNLYEKQTNSSVCMVLRKVEEDGIFYLEMVRTSVQFTPFKRIDGKIVPVSIAVKSNVATRRDISGPEANPEPVSAAAIRRRLGQMQEDNVDADAQEVYLETEFPEPEEKALIKELLQRRFLP